MTALRLVLRRVCAHALLSVMLLGGLVLLAGAVESAGLGWSGLLRALLRTPGLVVALMPTAVALGSGLTAARMAARGERTALEGAGLSPASTGRAALLAGILAGVSGWGVHSTVVPAAEAIADALQPAEVSAWTWVEGGAIRSTDQLGLRIENGRILDVQQPWPVEEATLEQARLEQQPWKAPAGVLARSNALPARIEHHARLARILGCGLLAFLGWLPWSRRPIVQLGAALCLGLAFQVVDAMLQALSAQGRLPAGLGAWAALLPLVLLAATAPGASSR